MNYNLKLIRVVTFLYGLLISGIVISASCRWFPEVFGWVQSVASDKVLHFVLVGTLALLLNLSLRCQAVFPQARWLLRGTAIMLAIATVEEFSQIWFRNRTFDLGDLGCNYLGIAVLGSLALLCRPSVEKPNV